MQVNKHCQDSDFQLLSMLVNVKGILTKCSHSQVLFLSSSVNEPLVTMLALNDTIDGWLKHSPNEVISATDQIRYKNSNPQYGRGPRPAA